MKRVLALVLVAACGSSSPPAEPDAAIGADTTVTVFAGEHVYFGEENRRVVDTEVSFPAPGQHFSSVTMRIGLRCPTGGCDWWDRLGHLSILDGDREIEIARFITPYRVPGPFEIDVTDLQRLLEGDRTVRVFIDTWVGPGHANGAGWLVDVEVDFEGGLPSPEPYAVIPLWAPQGVVFGDPARPAELATTVEIPEGATGARLVSYVTGHGQGNAGNCAEFCSKFHTITVGDEAVDAVIWRDDCEATAVPGQQGTWTYPRAGWCPGAIVHPWSEDVAVAAGPVDVTWSVEPYENTCRPDAPVCTGCTLGTGCEYDGGAHTEPRYELSALLVLLR